MRFIMSLKMRFSDFVSMSRKVYGEKYEYDEESFDGSHAKTKIICPIHGEFYQTPRYHLKSLCGCPKCSYEYRKDKLKKTRDEFITDAVKIHGEKYDYSKVEYVNAHTKVCIICKKHGEFYQRPNDHLNGEGCPKCNDSHLEREMCLLLNENNITYERNKHFPWLGKLELDFYIPSKNIAIECQGKQHIGFGGWSSKCDFEQIYEYDLRKNKLCNENNIFLIYLFDKQFFKKKDSFEIYNDTNSFYDKNKIFTLLEHEDNARRVYRKSKENIW